jgi:hypothetical protein
MDHAMSSGLYIGTQSLHQIGISLDPSDVGYAALGVGRSLLSEMGTKMQDALGSKAVDPSQGWKRKEHARP